MWTLALLHDAFCAWEPLLRGDGERAGTTALAATALQLCPHQRRSCMAPAGLEPTPSGSVGPMPYPLGRAPPLLAHCGRHKPPVALAAPQQGDFDRGAAGLCEQTPRALRSTSSTPHEHERRNCMTPAGLEPAIPSSVGRRLIH